MFPTRDYQGKRVNPHIGLVLKVVPLNLFLDMVLSSFRGCDSCDAWTAEATFSQLAETKWRERQKTILCFDFQKTFHGRDVFCTLSHLHVRLGFCLFCACLAVHSLPFIWF